MTFQGVFSHTWDTWERALRLEAGGQVQLRPMISHRVPLQDWKVAFDALEHGEAIKALIFPNGVERVEGGVICWSRLSSFRWT